MKTFLDQLAEEVLKSGDTDFSNLCVVLPNRRAGVFLRDALTRARDRTIWAPKILSIEDFVFQLSGYVKVDRTTLLFSFYEVYKRKVKDPQSLELFANWAPTFLSDINEVDINLVDAQDIFYQLSSVERISKWNPDGKPLTEFQKKHIQFVETFYEMYEALRAQLESENKAYQGMAFRRVAEQFNSQLNNCEWSTVWFAGFNALTVSEEAIMHLFLAEKKARIFWDMDEFYANDPIHEAGLYIRKYQQQRSRLKLDSEYNWKQNHLSDHPKEIHIISAQRSVAQAEAASFILNEKCERSKGTTLSNTAVVLNDEKVLLPLLSTLPTQLTGVNITMGYGLRFSQSVVFVDKLFELYSGISSNGKFYHKHVLSILTDGIYNSISERNISGIRRSIVKQKLNYLKADEISVSEFDELLFGLRDFSVSSFLKYLKDVSELISNAWSADHHVLESKFLSLIERMIVRLTDLHSEFGGIETLKTLHVFWRQLINGQNLDFVGEPIGGLQIMGMLETRNLDFEELIILGVNEGSLPSNAQAPTNFTFDVRQAFGLACQNERDAVTAYHFYRLIQRAKKVYLIYDQDTTSFGGGEVSRYVQQLEMESPPNIRIKKWGIAQNLPKTEAFHEIAIEKGSREIEKLLDQGNRGFSPSALNIYRTCPLKFYFRYVAGFKEELRLNEEVDHATFGTAIHNTLDSLYRSYLGKPLQNTDLEQMTKKVDSELLIQFSEQVSNDRLQHGRNLLAYEVAKTYVNRVISHDLSTIRSGNLIIPLLLEEELRSKIEFSCNGKTFEVNVQGLVDRIDRLSDGTTRVIDYKSGSFDKTVEIKNEIDFDNAKSDNAFQLLLYGLMYHSENPKEKVIQPTVFFLRSKEIEQPVTLTFNKVLLTSTEQVEFTRQKLSSVLSEMFDTDVSFTQTSKTENCEYCDFKNVCQR